MSTPRAKKLRMRFSYPVSEPFTETACGTEPMARRTGE
jgi:hypothetical protein